MAQDFYTCIIARGGFAGEYEDLVEAEIAAAPSGAYTPGEEGIFRVVATRTVQLLKESPVYIETFQSSSCTVRVPSGTSPSLIDNDAGDGRFYFFRNSNAATGSVTVETDTGTFITRLSPGDFSLVVHGDAGAWDVGLNTDNDLHIYDAVIPDDYALPSEAFNSTDAPQTVFVRNGTYVETADISIPEGGALIGENSNNTIIDLSGGYQVIIDGSGGALENTGTVGLTNGSTAVTGSGTTFTNLSPGDFLVVCTACLEIASITDDDNLTLTEAWQGNTTAAFSYFATTLLDGVRVDNLKLIDSTVTGLFIRAVNKVNVTNVFIEGCNNGAEIIDCCEVSLANLTGHSCTVSGLEVNGTRGLNATHLHCNNNGADGILLDGNAFGIHIDNSFGGNNDGDGCSAEGTSTDVFISNTRLCSNAGKGYNSEPTSSRSVLEGCACLNNGSYGIDLDGASNSTTSCVAEFNGISGIRTGDSTIVDACQANNNLLHGIEMNEDTLSIVSNCEIHDNGGDGINLTAVPSNDDILIIGNIIYDNTGSGIEIASGVTGVRIIGNRIFGHTTNIVDPNATTVYDSQATGAGVTGPILHNFGASVDPTASDNITLGYQVGSRWVNITDNTSWLCVDNSTTAAIWIPTNDVVQYRYSNNNGVPGGGTRFMRTGQGIRCSAVGDLITQDLILRSVTIAVNVVEGSNTYDVEVISDPAGSPVVLATLAFGTGTRTDTGTFNVAILAGTEIGVRMVRATGSGGSDFDETNITLALERS